MEHNHNRDIFIVFLCIAISALLYGAIKREKPMPLLIPDSIMQDGEKDIPDSMKKEIEDYIRKNITALSDEKAVLGGTFYVTDINWQMGPHGAVFYEDGHYAFKRLFTVTFHEQGEFSVAFDMIVPE